MRKSRSKRQKVTPNLERVQVKGEALEINVSADQLLGEVAVEIEAFSAQIGLRIMHAVMEHEVGTIVGPWGRQRASISTATGKIQRRVTPRSLFTKLSILEWILIIGKSVSV